MKPPSPIASLLADFQVDASSPRSPALQKALCLARHLQSRAERLQSEPERRKQAELARMLTTPADKAILALMTDQAFRTANSSRAVEHLAHVLGCHGIPRFFSAFDRVLLKGFCLLGGLAPNLALGAVKRQMLLETAKVILPGERDPLLRHLALRRQEELRMNVNFLGEAILSEEEAARRLDQYLQRLLWPETEVVSIKISTLYSQISPLAREHTLGILCDRLEHLIRAADAVRFTRPNGVQVPKFVYLDMEEYRDMALTAEAFMRTLDRPALAHSSAGIALQSYIPDSYLTLLRIQKWARGRVVAGGGRITIRLVKGANMESERVEASLRGWPQAPFKTKQETDANYRRMLQESMRPENLAAMNVGVASHNLFELAYALVLADEANAFDAVQFEMLEGMANPQRRALSECTRNLLLYAPVCPRENFLNAVGYLIRRLDENTGPENFLRHLFHLKVGSRDWCRLEESFISAFDVIPRTNMEPRRRQDRRRPPEPAALPDQGWAHFVNEPDTDFALPANGDWAEAILSKWREIHGEQAVQIPLVVDGRALAEWRTVRDCSDPSRPGYIVARCQQASSADVDCAVECAMVDADGWRSRPEAERFEVLGRVAQELRCARGDLLGAALANAGKTLSESDPEVSEAIDFVEFYRSSARWWQSLTGVSARPKGVVVVVSPWNFPIAIPCGGLAAALAAGNTVILKPASDAVLPAWLLCECFWRAGVSRKTLQFVPCSGAGAGRRLVSHPKVNAVILTGGTETALAMLQDNPQMTLYAETGGKDATIVTALSDRDLAIRHVLHSAFSHSGQKCSATSLLLLQAEVYDDPAFRRALSEAARSLVVGSAWALETKLGPLIRPPSGDLLKALSSLEPGEEWALVPQASSANPGLWSPGIKYGVRPGSFTHMTEFFGPILAVMRFETLEEAVALVNQTGYGLTSGLESLDDREWALWRQGIRAGNLYINRPTTGAIVLRQPFGGLGKSCFGPGLKAGGPNYLAQLMEFEDQPCPADSDFPLLAHPFLKALALQAKEPWASEASDLGAAFQSYERAWQTEFSGEHDHFRLLGQDNIRRYFPVGAVRVRIHPNDTLFEVFARLGAAVLCGCFVVLSAPPGISSPLLSALTALEGGAEGRFVVLVESDRDLAQAVREGSVDRFRFASPKAVTPELLTVASQGGVPIISRPVSAEGRLELLWYLHEQSVSTDYHRYGNLGIRAAEARTEPL